MIDPEPEMPNKIAIAINREIGDDFPKFMSSFPRQEWAFMKIVCA
jgi:hypothetical protein